MDLCSIKLGLRLLDAKMVCTTDVLRFQQAGKQKELPEKTTRIDHLCISNFNVDESKVRGDS